MPVSALPAVEGHWSRRPGRTPGLGGLARLAVAAVMLLGALARPARAMSVIPPTFPELVQTAEQIVRVQVTEITSRYDTAAADSLIHTYVKGRVLRSLKGDAQETITLRLLGGQVGNEVMRVPDMPEFAVGETYIFFVEQNGRAFCPLVGVMHGTYPVVKDATAAGTERVLRNNREPLRDLAGVVRPMGDASGPAAAAVGSALSVAEFEAAIIKELANAKDR